MSKPLSPHLDVLYRIKRGLSGYVSYLAACEMNPSFSEYVLYEPMLRILTARGFTVKCEVPCPGFPPKNGGDLKRIDFVAISPVNLAIEVKWAKKSTVNVARDVEKLRLFLTSEKNALAVLCMFGTQSALAKLELRGAGSVQEQGKPIFAEFGVTRYGCRMYFVND